MVKFMTPFLSKRPKIFLFDFKLYYVSKYEKKILRGKILMQQI